MMKKKTLVPADKEEKSREIFQDFVSTTTVHGLGKAFGGKSWMIRRIIWFLSLLAALGVLCYHLGWLIKDVNSHPFKTISRVTPMTSIPFPTITLCDLNIMDATRLNHTEEVKKIFRLLNPQGDWVPVLNITLDKMRSYEPYKSILQNSYKTFIETAGPTVKGSFFHCSWDNEEIDCGEHLVPVFTSMGKCFQFNNNWSSQRKSSRPGSKSGFYAVLMVNPDGHTTSEFNALGFKILLHNIYDFPDMHSKGFLISPGFHYDISFQKFTYQYLPDPFYSMGDKKCVDSPPEKYQDSEVHGRYSLTECLLHRCKNLTIEQCGCDQYNCTVDEYLTCYKPTFDDIYTSAASNNNWGCPYPCHASSYEPTISQAYTPSPEAEFYAARVSNGNFSTSQIRRTIMGLNLYFEDMIVRESVHVAQYDSLTIMGTVGGNMGFFLGASVLTVAEFAEFLLFLLWWLLMRMASRCGLSHKVHTAAAT